MKRRIGGFLLVERLGPEALEVDGVAEDEPRIRADASLREEIADLAVRPLLHPGVDGVPRRFRIAVEVGLLRISAVVLARDIEESPAEWVPLLPPPRGSQSGARSLPAECLGPGSAAVRQTSGGVFPAPAGSVRRSPSPRSEEHTSELQSRLHLVCRLLLEKKKKHQYLVH